MCPTVSPARRITGTQLPVLVESPLESPRGLPRSGREVLAPVFTCENDPPRGVDESDAVGETVLDGRLGVPALCADAGHEEGEVRDRFADRFEFLGSGGADDEADVAAFVPVGGQRRDALVDGFARGEFEVRARTNTPVPVRERNGSSESRPRYGLTVMASAPVSSRRVAYWRAVLPMSARLASSRTGTSFPRA